MKLLITLFLLLLALPQVTASEEVQAGQYTITVSTQPKTLEPGDAKLNLHVKQDVYAAAKKSVWVRLRGENEVFFASTLVTDESGEIEIDYYFDGPGLYSLELEVDGARAIVPIQVHGQYVLAFGFLAAIFIVLALLLRSH